MFASHSNQARRENSHFTNTSFNYYGYPDDNDSRWIHGKNFTEFRNKKYQIYFLLDTVIPCSTRLFTVLYFSERSSRSSALRYGLPSCMSVKLQSPTPTRSVGTFKNQDSCDAVTLRRGFSERSHEKIGDCEQSNAVLIYNWSSICWLYVSRYVCVWLIVPSGFPVSFSLLRKWTQQLNYLKIGPPWIMPLVVESITVIYRHFPRSRT